MNEPKFCHNLFLTALCHCLFKCLKPLKNYVIKMAIYKTRNTGTGNGMRGLQGTAGMFIRIPGNL